MEMILGQGERERRREGERERERDRERWSYHIPPYLSYCIERSADRYGTSDRVNPCFFVVES